MSDKKILSVVMPVYNEKNTVAEIIKRVLNVKLPGISIQLIVVDDGSTDGTREILKKLSKSNRAVTLMLSEKNGGKGKALIEGFKLVNGDFTVIQDADLEYDPEDYVKLLEPILKGNADVVFGSRFSGQHKAFLFMNYVANKILNLITNILYNTILTDMETCYKMFKTPVIKDLSLVSRGFEIESEITAKILKNKLRIYEVPINYNGRSYKDGKKIKASDGFKALFALIRYRF